MTADASNTSAGSDRGDAASDSIYLLTLFVTGQSVRSQRAVANLRRLCEALRGLCELTVVDVLERPQLAEEEKIMATPTVIRRRPLPVRRVIGDLSDPEKVLLWLDLPSGNASNRAEDVL
jgi:circadian clock protein KaiB